MTIDLIKYIAPTSLRGYGSRPSGVEPHKLVVGGYSISSIKNAMNGTVFKVGRVSIKNAFCLVVDGCHYLYVSPTYKNYRQLAKRLFGQIHADHDIDHVLAKKLALLLNSKYVVIAMVHKKTNRHNGSIEKLGIEASRKINLSKTVHADKRIFHKILSRGLYARQTKEELKDGFDPNDIVQFGLTLKQKGIWNLAFGFHDDVPDKFLQSLIPF